MLLYFYCVDVTSPPSTYTLSLHDALPIFLGLSAWGSALSAVSFTLCGFQMSHAVHEPFYTLLPDRKSTRLNSSHQIISYAVFCLKKNYNDAIERTPSRGGVPRLGSRRRGR